MRPLGAPRTPNSLALAASAAVSIALVLAACGGSSDATRIDDAVTGFLKGGDPDACTRYATNRLLRELEGFGGRAAVERCRLHADDQDAAARDVTVSAIAVHGDAASARVVIAGGDLGNQRPSARLVRVADDWKVDSLDGLLLNGRLLRRFNRQFKRGLAATGKVARPQARCILHAIESDAAATPLEALSGRRLPPRLRAGVRAATRACVPRR